MEWISPGWRTGGSGLRQQNGPCGFNKLIFGTSSTFEIFSTKNGVKLSSLGLESGPEPGLETTGSGSGDSDVGDIVMMVT